MAIDSTNSIKKHWAESSIAAILTSLPNGKEINQGWSPRCKAHPSPSEEKWGVLKTTAIQPNEFRAEENKELPKDKSVRDHLEVMPGDILLTCAGPRNRCGIACRVRSTRKRLLLSGKMYRFKPNDKIVSGEYLVHYLQSANAQQQIDRMKTGGSESGLNLTQSRFRKLNIIIPPLPEQRAIVSKLEQLFSELEDGVANLQKARRQLKVYRQAVLKKAFEGELTREWRAQQTDLPTAEELLEQIQAERERYYEQQMAEWKQAVADWEADGKVGKKPRKPGKATFIDPSIKNTDVFIFPKDWKLVRTGDVIHPINNGYTPKREFLSAGEGDVPFIKVYNLNFDGTLNYRKEPFFIPEIIHRNDLGRSICFPGDVLTNIVGPPLGKVSIVPSVFKEWNINQAIVLFRPNSFISSKFISYFLQAPATIKWLEGTSKATAGQFNVKVTTCREIPFPLCSHIEQHQIVQEIESRLSVCDQLEKDIEANLKRAGRLRQSLLQKAFAGELLTESELQACRAAPDWEPAEKLLERIKVEVKSKV